MKISALYISPGHNFFGRHGKPAGEHVTLSVKEVECVAGRGLRGDRFWEYKQEYAGQITFFDEAVHRSLLRELQPGPRSPAAYRRNAITRGVDLSTLIGQEFVVQGMRFLGVAESKPCYWMEQAVGVGAENFLKGRGGLRARILSDGILRVDCSTEAGLLLAGGRSRRMGRDKALIDRDGHTLRERQASALAQSGAWPLLLSCRPDQTWTPKDFVRVEDREMEGGVLAALADAWSATEAEVLTVLAIDVPKIRPELLERMAGLAREEGISIVPWHEERFEPLVAAWHRSAVPALENAKVTGRSLQDVCATLQRDGLLRSFEPGAAEVGQLTNVNTPDDLVRLG
jgi:molybdopterin-guanine dinucleotide biosynthesis protein A